MQDHDFLSSLPQGCNELSRLLALCEQHLTGIVSVQGYEYTSCYLWHDRPLYDSFGDTIKVLSGDTIYLNEESLSLNGDLFHELGHVVARKFNLVGHSENSYQGTWENNNAKLIAQVAQQRHWSQYLNLFSLNHDDFKANAASELWAELFMLWHLYPDQSETELIRTTMRTLNHQQCSADACGAIRKLAAALRLTS